jgi:hypothetical protein
VSDLAQSASRFAALLEAEGVAVAVAANGVRAARRLPLGAQWLELVEPDAVGELRDSLRARGEGPFEVVLSGGASARELPLTATHGARIRLGG